MYPAPALEETMHGHCKAARHAWNLALEQANWYRPSWGQTPGFAEQCRQLTEARAAFGWLADWSVTVQQQALRDFNQAMASFFRGTHRRPRWRKAGEDEGFRVVAVKVGHVRRLNRRWAEILVPKAGWVRFRLTGPLPVEAKSYRVTLDQAGRWHIAFALMPLALERKPTGSAVGIDRGVANTLATSDGDLLQAPSLSTAQRARLVRLQRKLARQKKGSRRRATTKAAVARLRATEADRAKDWVEKTTTALVVANDFIAVEALKIRNMTRSARGTVEVPGRGVRQKAALNRSILASRWGLFARRLREKCDLASVTLAEVDPAYTSQRCHACGNVAQENRESQAVFRCGTCGHTAHADINAAMNILAAGRAVTAQGGDLSAPLICEPQHAPPKAA